MGDSHHRRSIRLEGYDYTQPGAYFVTICTEDHEPLFGEVIADEMRLNLLGQIAHAEWLGLFSRFPFLVEDAFIVMPSHVHGILVINDDGRGMAGPSVTDDRSPSSHAPDTPGGGTASGTPDFLEIKPRRASTMASEIKGFGKPVPAGTRAAST